MSILKLILYSYVALALYGMIGCVAIKCFYREVSLFKLLFSWAVKFIMDMPLLLLGYVVFPVAYIWANKFKPDGWRNIGGAALPAWADWIWGNDKHGIYGDEFYSKATAGWAWLPQPVYWFVRGFMWSVVRNPTYNWCQRNLGKVKKYFMKVIGNNQVSRDRQQGMCWATGDWNQGWDLHIVKRYGSSKRCLHVRIGWKLINKLLGERCTFVFLISPFQLYTGA